MIFFNKTWSFFDKTWFFLSWFWFKNGLNQDFESYQIHSKITSILQTMSLNHDFKSMMASFPCRLKGNLFIPLVVKMKRRWKYGQVICYGSLNSFWVLRVLNHILFMTGFSHVHKSSNILLNQVISPATSFESYPKQHQLLLTWAPGPGVEPRSRRHKLMLYHWAIKHHDLTATIS